MIPELGHFALVLALCLALAQVFFGIVGAHRNSANWMATARSAAIGQSVFIILAFGTLVYLFLVSDFSVAYVAANSYTDLPWFYRITAVWGAHKGSLLLWVFILGLWTLGVVRFSRGLPATFVSRVLGVMAVVSIGFLLFMLFTSDPFTRLLPPAVQGRDLNPILQDPAMVAHPPILYTGYVGFCVAFAFAVAALIDGRMDAVWARWARPWTTVAWLFLTMGITLGSWWSYYELGWGGWWFWDPVENASFMPWLVGTALVHSLAVTEKRGAFKSWTALLAITAFSLSLLGTFLVRSGVLISVHAFASDPSRGIFILALIAIITGSALAVYTWRAPQLTSGGSFFASSRESFLLFNNVFLVVAAAAILLGTLYPLVLDAMGLGKLSVGPPYFNAVFVPLMMPLLILIGIGPYMRWKHGSLLEVARQLALIIAIAVGTTLLVMFLAWSEISVLSLAGILLGTWTILTALREPWRRWRLSAGTSRKIPRSVLGMSIAHLGVGLVVLGITITSTMGIERDLTLTEGQSAVVHGYSFRLDKLGDVKGPNYVAKQATVNISRDGVPVTTLYPQKRRYDSQQSATTEAAISPGLFRDLYVALGDPVGNNAWSLRIQYKPWVRFIWLGGVVMFFGGLVAISDRRYRKRATAEITEPVTPAGETG